MLFAVPPHPVGQLNLFRTSAFRLTLLYLVLFGTSVLALLGFIYWSTVAVIEQQTMETIEAEARGLAEQYRQGGMEQLIAAVRHRAETTKDNVYLLTDHNLKPIAGNLNTWPTGAEERGPWVRLNVSRREAQATINYQVRARLFMLSGGFRLLVGRDTYERARFEKIVLNALTWSLAGAAALGVGGGLFLSRRMLRRVDEVSRTARQIVAGDLSLRLARTGSDDEFDRLADSVNGMLDQIERLMTGMRLATDSLAHDLRSPLTRLRGRIELALREPPDAGNDREALIDVLAQADAALATFNNLLKIAAAEAGTARSEFAIVDLAVIALDAYDLYEPVAEDAGIKLSLDAPAHARLFGQTELLAQAVANLLDNALKYTPPGGHIGIVVREHNGRVSLTVTDTGPGIPENERDRVLERFVRLEECRRTPGAGLGLSLVKAVTALHDGTLTLFDCRPGLGVTLDFPAAEAKTDPTREEPAARAGKPLAAEAGR
jgi:signal transduction histidine kinase